MDGMMSLDQKWVKWLKKKCAGPMALAVLSPGSGQLQALRKTGEFLFSLI